MKQAFFILSAILLLTGCIKIKHEQYQDQNQEQTQNMPITVNLRYTGTNGNAWKFAEEMMFSGTVAAIRAEEGNLRYEYYQSLDDPETILLIDSWASQEAIDAHHATPMMEVIANLREKYDLHMTVERYTSAETPETENQFIRE
ncbi:MAG: antibiotic biosynthesis monooxygenase [Bacteroidales bacterium]|nr:antibiotic biosynthesis monooxygenase [Bacteroidales bacterium]